jgi:import receptor subunit TOM20
MTQLNYLIYGSALALGSYCAYFDYKRRNDSEFQSYLKTQKKKAAAMRSSRLEAQKKRYDINIPEPLTEADKESFVMQNLQLGEKLVLEGPVAYDAAATCFYRALKYIGAQAQTLFEVLSQSLPPAVIQLVIQKMKDDMEQKPSNPSKLEELEGVE